MEKLFYAHKTTFPSSIDALKHVLSRYFGCPSAQIVKDEHGKPFVENVKDKLFVSVSHTQNALFIAVSDENVGLDAEPVDRTPEFAPVLKRFPVEERAEIKTTADFLRHWTVKESAVKWLGGTLAHDLKKLSFSNNVLKYNGIELPVFLTERSIENHFVAVCCERDFTDAEIVVI